MRCVKAPNRFFPKKEAAIIFLAGSIEMGKAEPWQEKLTSMLAAEDVLVLNPRRESWDSSWKQTINNEKFKEQVDWELLGQEQADIIAMYFDPKTQSPITLLELGLAAKSGKLIVCCPDGFWRKGNVEVTSNRYGFALVQTLEELHQAIMERLHGADPSVSMVTKFTQCYWCGSKEHDMMQCPDAAEAKIAKCWQKVAEELVDGDYIGTLRGEVNICLNIINYYKALSKAMDELADPILREKLRNRAYAIRAERYGRLLW
jgi:hypothetical protein